MDHDLLLKQVLQLLNVGGEDEIVPANGVLRRYEDPKIVIEGFASDQDQRNYKRLMVGIKLIDKNMPQSAVSLGLRKSDRPYVTTVLQYTAPAKSNQLMLELFRPGRWLQYLGKLYKDWRDQQKYLETANNLPIDDSVLFPEFEDIDVNP